MSAAEQNRDPATRSAYAYCRAVARRDAKNFYYSFRVLPPAKSDAMCAVYAFMRRADDIADDESKLLAERRVEMAAWLAQWRESRHAKTTGDPVFLAVHDTQLRFAISDELLEQLVQGTAMDLDQAAQPEVVMTREAGGSTESRSLQVYPDFASLYRYCYLVASVVGLVCIKIFGYTDPAAEILAERTGIAFQLTNILRDVKEDVERGRIYLPQDLLTQNHVSNGDLLALAAGRPLQPNERAMLGALAAGAHQFYAASRELLPMIHPDSRAALWVLVEIYERLLGRMDRRGGDVFSARACVPTAEKLLVLARGGWMGWTLGRGIGREDFGPAGSVRGDR
jgi:phytoene synthase